LLVNRGVLKVTFWRLKIRHGFELYFLSEFSYFILREGDADDDDRALDARDERVLARVARERVHDVGGCEAVSWVASAPAVRAGPAVRCVA
jgi:hypothetical protein